jgi:type I restriction enzyme S subunit
MVTPSAQTQAELTLATVPLPRRSSPATIPSDWETKPFKQISTPVRGASPRPAGDPHYFNGSYIPWLTVAALTNLPDSTLVVSETATCLTEEGSYHSRTLEPGTLIIANSGATLGVAKILGIKCCANDGIAALLDLDPQVCPRYLAYYINSQTEYLRSIVARGNGQPNLNTTLIGDFVITLPSNRYEQEAIAEALGDADSYIESLERLIEKKRLIKQGAMQDLLSGRRRLPGFDNEWPRTKLDKALTFEVGFPFSSRHFNHEGYGVRIVRNRDLKSDNTALYYAGAFSPEYVVKNGDLLVGMDGEFVTCLWKSGKALLNQRIGRIIPGPKASVCFLYYHLKETLRRIEARTMGTTVKHLSHRDVESLELPLPSIEEQEAIAAVLNSMDADLDALEEEITKARQIKQGMMQELLTGRVRLV